MANKPFNVYFGERIAASGAPPVGGYDYLVDNDGVVEKTVFGDVAGFAGFQDDSIITTIPAVSTWVPIANTLLERVITPNLVFAANAFTYVGNDTIAPTRIFASMSCKKAPISSSSMVFRITVAINGTEVLDYMSVDVNDVERSYVSTTWFQTLQQNDVITMLVQNVSGDHDLILIDGQLSVG